jgi:hypothetical protein
VMVLGAMAMPVRLFDEQPDEVRPWPGLEPARTPRMAALGGFTLGVLVERGLGQGLQVHGGVLLGGMLGLGAAGGLKWQPVDLGAFAVAVVGDLRLVGGLDTTADSDITFVGARAQLDLLVGVRGQAWSVSVGPRGARAIAWNSEDDREWQARELGGVAIVQVAGWFVETSVSHADAAGLEAGLVIMVGVGRRE